MPPSHRANTTLGGANGERFPLAAFAVFMRHLSAPRGLIRLPVGSLRAPGASFSRPAT